MAIAWVIAKGFLPIPGTKRRKYIEENIVAASITLSPEEMKQIEVIIPLGTQTGERYDPSTMSTIDK